jgi:hypothetical protein
MEVNGRNAGYGIHAEAFSMCGQFAGVLSIVAGDMSVVTPCVHRRYR